MVRITPAICIACYRHYFLNISKKYPLCFNIFSVLTACITYDIASEEIRKFITPESPCFEHNGKPARKQILKKKIQFNKRRICPFSSPAILSQYLATQSVHADARSRPATAGQQGGCMHG